MVITYMWDLEKNDTSELIYKTERDCSKESVLHLAHLPSPVSTHLFTVIVLSFPECHVVAIIKYIAFSDQFFSLQFSAQSCPTLRPHGLPGFPVCHQLPELAQIHVHRVTDAIQPSHALLPTSPPAFNPSQHQGLF